MGNGTYKNLINTAKYVALLALAITAVVVLKNFSPSKMTEDAGLNHKYDETYIMGGSRVYEFTPKGSPDMSCVYVNGGLTCFFKFDPKQLQEGYDDAVLDSK